MDNVPKGFKAGTDYVSAVSADNFGNGVVSAHLMAKALGAKGKIGLIFHEADFFVTRQRYDGFKQTIQSDYPEIQIVEEQGIAGPDFAGDAQGVANAMLSKHPDLGGIWAVWDVPAEGGWQQLGLRVVVICASRPRTWARTLRSPWRRVSWSSGLALNDRSTRALPRLGLALGRPGREDTTVRRAERAARAARQRPRCLEAGLPRGRPDLVSSFKE